MSDQHAERKLAAILAADVAGYSRLMHADEEGTLRRFRAHLRELIEPRIAQHRGRIVKRAGDGLLIDFASAVEAVRCAVAIQAGMAEREHDIGADRRIAFRMGINLGDIVIDGEDIYGDGVNIAARLEAIAEPGTIYVSRAVRDFVRDDAALALDDLGERALKNIATAVRVFRIGGNGAPPAPAPASPSPKGPGAPALPDKPAIAVLPFMNMSGDAEQEYFSDGITEDLITDLSKVSGLLVIARNSSFSYKGRSVKVQDIGQDLGVGFVLEGSIRKAGNRVRITAQLIDAGNGGHLWAERFDRDLTDIFATQDEVVEKIVGALAVKLTRGEQQRLRRRGTNSVEAYEVWLKARSRLGAGSRAAVDEARSLHRQAIAIDPSFAAPHAGLALASTSYYVSGWAEDPAAALDDAERWARRALELDDQDPAGHMALASVMLWRRNHDAALVEAGRMIALDPNYAQGYGMIGLVQIYASQPAAALRSFATGMRLDPHYAPILFHFQAQAQFSLGEFETAAALLRQRITRDPGTDASRMLLASCYGHLGRVAEARAEWAALLKVNPGFQLAQRARVLPYKDPAEFQRIVEGLAQAGLP